MIYWITLLTIALDQITKALVQREIAYHDVMPIIPTVNLVHVMNKGVSFSFLASDSPLMPWILAGVAIMVCVGIGMWLWKEKNSRARGGLALILGGAIGNVIDRVRFGAVVDFLDFYVGDWHWPAFNVADSAICLGVALVLLQSFRKKEKK